MMEGASIHQRKSRRRLDIDNEMPSVLLSADQCLFPTSGVFDTSSFGYYDAIYYAHQKSNGFETSSRIGSVEVVPPIEDEASSIKTSQSYALMRFISIIAFSASTLNADGTQTLVVRGNGGTQIFGDVSGLMLGMHHFNNGVGDVVREATDINKRCPIRFVLDDFYDSESSQVIAVDHFGRTIIENPNRPPSGLFGAWRSAVSVPLAILSGAYKVPQISPLSTSTELDDTTVYRYFSRLIPSDAGTAQAAVDYFRQPSIYLKHLGVLYVNDAYGSAFNQALGEAAVSRPEGERITVKGFPFSYNNVVAESARDIELQIEQLAQTGYRYFFGVFYDEHYELIMEAAHKFGIAGPGYVWIISDGLSETFLDGRVYEPGSALAVASQGIGILKAEGGRETADGNTGFDRFAKAWFEQGAENVNYYNCKQPKTNSIDDASIYFKAEPDFFTSQQLYPTAGAVFTYDSAIAMGLAACKLYEQNGDAYFDGEELFDAFISQSFEGASGTVNIDPRTTSRDPRSAFFVLYNAKGEAGAGGTAFSVKTVVHTAPNPNSGSSSVLWVSVDGEEFFYSDGTTMPPDTLPASEEDLNQLSTGIRGAGLALAALVIVGSLFFSGWTLWHRQNRVVRASQPVFLHMICVGTLILGSTIIPLSIDDSVASLRGCDIACMSSPWMFAYGFTTVFSALFSKTWRINKIMHNARFKRMKVTASDVIKPFIILLALNTIVLIVWTMVDPLSWERMETENIDQFERTNESYGICTSDDKGYLPYVILLLLINLSVVVLANYQAYRARNIATEFSESKYIAIIMASIFQASVIGLPLFVLVSNDPSSSFIVRTGIIAVICLSTLCFMFIPKMMHLKEGRIKAVEKQKLKQERQKAREDMRRKAPNYASNPSDRSAVSVRKTDMVYVQADMGSSSKTHKTDFCSSGMIRGNDEGFDHIDMGPPTTLETADTAEDAPTVHAPEDDTCIEDTLEKVMRDDDEAGQLEVDEELAVTDAAAAAPMQSILSQSVDHRRTAVVAFAPHETPQLHRHSTFASNGTTDDDFDDGLEINITGRVSAQEVESLRNRLNDANIEKLDLIDKVRSLKVLLAKNGINEDPHYSLGSKVPVTRGSPEMRRSSSVFGFSTADSSQSSQRSPVGKTSSFRGKLTPFKSFMNVMRPKISSQEETED